MSKVAIVMGSDSDLSTMRAAGDFLTKMGIEYEYNIISAHREPDIFFKWARELRNRGIKVVIAGAGKAAHLPGMCAALTPLPVIVQMPGGIPVATVAINGAKNAGILATKMLALNDEGLFEKLEKFSDEMAKEVEAKDGKLKSVGVDAFLKG